jgi:hypothetical protein
LSSSHIQSAYLPNVVKINAECNGLVVRFVNDELYPFCKEVLKKQKADFRSILHTTDTLKLPDSSRAY